MGRPFLTHLTFPQKVFGLGKRWAAASFKVKLEGHDFGAGALLWAMMSTVWFNRNNEQNLEERNK